MFERIRYEGWITLEAQNKDLAREILRKLHGHQMTGRDGSVLLRVYGHSRVDPRVHLKQHINRIHELRIEYTLPDGSHRLLLLAGGKIHALVGRVVYDGENQITERSSKLTSV